MTKSRSIALIMCLVALVITAALRPVPVMAVAAAQCQQTCDNAKTACEAACYAETTLSSYAENVCLNDCLLEWNYCSYSAYSCDETDPTIACYLCWVNATPSCTGTGTCNYSILNFTQSEFFGCSQMSCPPQPQ